MRRRRQAVLSQGLPYLVAELDFDNETAVQAALTSPEGQATAGDLANFATGGATILSYEVRFV